MVEHEDAGQDFDLLSFIPYRLALAAQITSEKLAKRYGPAYGITVADWRVLAHITQKQGLSVRDVEKEILMEKSKVSRATTRLEKAGLITKKPSAHDKRLVVLHLTDSGKTLVSKLFPLASKYQQEIETKLGASLAEFNTALDRLIADA